MRRLPTRDRCGVPLPIRVDSDARRCQMTCEPVPTGPCSTHLRSSGRVTAWSVGDGYAAAGILPVDCRDRPPELVFPGRREASAGFHPGCTGTWSGGTVGRSSATVAVVPVGG